jgi:hypothetical protein
MGGYPENVDSRDRFLTRSWENLPMKPATQALNRVAVAAILLVISVARITFAEESLLTKPR